MSIETEHKPFTLSEHQKWTTAKVDTTLNHEQTVQKYLLGLVEEVGEVTSLIKKHFYNGKILDREKLTEELGDVSWYYIALCDSLGLDVQYILQANRYKLDKRYPTEYSHEACSARADEIDKTK